MVQDILVLDSSLDMLELFAAVFLCYGFQIRTAQNLSEFQQQIIEKKPSLIIADSRSIRKEQCRELKQRADTRSTAIVLTSTDLNVLHNYEAYSADDVLEKPFNIDDLIQKATNLFTSANVSIS